jgi:hypothetical protein
MEHSMSGGRRDEQRSRPAVGEDHQAAVRKRLLGAGSDGSQRHGIADTQGGIGGPWWAISRGTCAK